MHSTIRYNKKKKAMSPLNVELQTLFMSFRPTGRNLSFFECIKISPVGRNDTLLIKLSILSVTELIENTVSPSCRVCF